MLSGCTYYGGSVVWRSPLCMLRIPRRDGIRRDSGIFSIWTLFRENKNVIDQCVNLCGRSSQKPFDSSHLMLSKIEFWRIGRLDPTVRERVPKRRLPLPGVTPSPIPSPHESSPSLVPQQQHHHHDMTNISRVSYDQH